MIVAVPNSIRAAVRSVVTIAAFLITSLAVAGPGNLARAYDDPPNQASDNFGKAVGATGSQLLVGAPGVGTTGATYVFTQASGTPQSSLLIPSGLTAHAFGSALATTSSQILVGDPDAVISPSVETTYLGGVVLYQGVNDTNPLLIPDPVQGADGNFGAALSISSVGYAIGAPSLTTQSVTNAGRAYVYTGGSAVPAFIFDNPAPGSETGFGTAVAYSEDGILAIGAPGSPTATSGGSVSFYDGASGALLQTLANPGAAGDQFGYALANIGGDIVIGAPSATGGGKAYVYDRATRALKHTLADPTPTTGGQFGFAIDAINHYIYIGAPNDTSTAAGAGTVNVFDSNTGSHVLAISNPVPSSGDSFGNAVAATGVNVLVGDPTSTKIGGAANAGQAFLMGGPDSITAAPAAPTGLAAVTISSTQIRINFTDNSNNEMGFVVERRLQSGGTFVPVQALAENTTEYLDGGLAPSTGYCYRVKAFNGDGESDYTTEACSTTFAGIIPEFIDRFPNPGGPGDLFGFSISAMGKTKLAPSCVAIAAPGNDNAGTSAGIVYVFDRTSLQPLVTLVNPRPGGAPEFGYSVGAMGKYIFVGSPYDDTDGQDAGIAYMFDGESGILLHTFRNPSPHAGDHFGKSVAGRGKTQVVIGAPGFASQSGAVYVMSAFSAAPIASVVNPTPADGDQFGAAVAGLKGTVAVAAPGADGSSANSGELIALSSKGLAKGYFGTASTVASAAGKGLGGASEQGTNGSGFAFMFSGKKAKVIYPNPSPDNGDAFGFAVAGAKKIVAVGAPLDDSTGTNTGEAYLFTQKLPFVLRAYINPAPNEGDQFGYALSLAAPFAYVGAPYDDTDGDNAGSVYIYNAPVK